VDWCGRSVVVAVVGAARPCAVVDGRGRRSGSTCADAAGRGCLLVAGVGRAVAGCPLAPIACSSTSGHMHAPASDMACMRPRGGSSSVVDRFDEPNEGRESTNAIQGTLDMHVSFLQQAG